MRLLIITVRSRATCFVRSSSTIGWLSKFRPNYGQSARSQVSYCSLHLGINLNNVSFLAEIETMTYGTNPDWVNAEATVVVEGAMEMMKKKGTLAKGLEGVTRAVEAGVR
jgi:hypothetical protein